MRVGFDCAPLALNRAGEHRYAAALLEALGRRTDVSLELLGELRHAPENLVQRVALQGMVQAWYYPVALGLSARRADVRLVHHPRHLVPRARTGGHATVVTIHDVLPLRAPEHFSRAILANFRLLAPGAARRAARVLTGSEASRSDIVDLLGVAPERVVVTPYGVEPRFAPRRSPETLARLGIGARYVLCVGTLEPRKNLDGAVRAFAAATADSEDVQLVIVGGSGWGGGALGRELERLGERVVRPGYVTDDDLVALLSDAACFLYPSFFEGFGLPPLEALACGAPVVAANTSSLPEVLGDAAILVDPRDAAALADAVRRVLCDDGLASDLRRRGLERARRFTWDACAAATAAVYRDALAELR